MLELIALFAVRPEVITLVVAGLVLLTRYWLRGKDKLSVFQGSDTPEAVGFAVLQSMGDRNLPRRIGGGQGECRTFLPTLGSKLIFVVMILLAANLLYIHGFAEFWHEAGPVGQAMMGLVMGLAGLGVLHMVIWVSFAHKVTIEGDTITVVTESFRRKSAKLSDIVDVRMSSTQRPLYEVVTDDGAILKIYKFVSHREELLTILRAAKHRNRLPVGAEGMRAVANPKTDAFKHRLR